MTGPLAGTRIIELGAIGPCPFAAMLLADHGAQVIRIDRPSAPFDEGDALLRSRERMVLDLKVPADVERMLQLAETADALIEGFRPGTLERLGMGPDVLLARNPALVVGRMTGWGQSGPLAHTAGHDINYIAVTGALHAIGTAELPVPPLALCGDYGGGGMMLAFAVATALIHAMRTGQGQVIDCAMSDGTGLLMTPFYGYRAAGWWKNERAANLIDGAAHFYRAYRTRDDRFVAVGAIEPQFYALLLDGLGLRDDPEFARQNDRSMWPHLSRRLEDIFSQKTRDEWCGIFEGTDACFTPVLDLDEAPSHPVATSRDSFVNLNGKMIPAPAPRYSVTTLEPPRATIEVEKPA